MTHRPFPAYAIIPTEGHHRAFLEALVAVETPNIDDNQLASYLVQAIQDLHGDKPPNTRLAELIEHVVAEHEPADTLRIQTALTPFLLGIVRLINAASLRDRAGRLPYEFSQWMHGNMVLVHVPLN